MRSFLARLYSACFGLFFTLLVLATFCLERSWAEVAVPALSGRIVDQAGLLNSTDLASIEGILSALERETGAQVVVLTLPSTKPETIEQFSIRVVEAWKLGRAKVDDGVLLLVASKDRSVRIEVGYGLEGAIPDAIASRIIHEQILPEFRNGDMAGGIRAGVDSLSKVIRKEPLPEPQAQTLNAGDALGLIFFLLLFLGPIGGQILKAIFGPFFGSVVGAGITFLLASLALSFWMSMLASLLAFFFILLSDSLTMVSPYGHRSYRGYGGGFGGFGRGGSGGFSGGGGSFGGGGASGKW